MSKLVIDSPVFISSLGKPDTFTQSSNLFFKNISEEIDIVMPSLVIAEVITVIARQNSSSVPEAYTHVSQFPIVFLDTAFLIQLLSFCKNLQLKTSDFIIAATAKIHEASLITWDKQLLSSSNTICQAMTPKAYVEQY